MANIPDDYVSVKEYALIHSVSSRTVYRWLNAGLIFGVRLSSKTYIPIEEPSPKDFDYIDNTEPTEDQEEPSVDNEDDGGGGFSRPDDEDEDCGGCPCDTPDDIEVRDENDFPSADLRRHKAAQTADEARNYQAEIMCEPTRIIRRTSDCLYVVVVECSK